MYQGHYYEALFNSLLSLFFLTFLKCWSPSLTRGVVWNILSGDILSVPLCSVYRLDMISSRSEDFFTGRKRDLRREIG